MGTARILIIESERIVAADLKNILSAYGYKDTELAFSREEAQRKMGAFRPDLMLVDEKLVFAAGVSVPAGAAWREHDIPVIYISSRNSELLKKSNDRENRCVYVARPFNEEDIFLSVRRILSGRPQYHCC